MDVHQWLFMAVCVLSIHKGQVTSSETSSPVNVTFIKNAVDQGAVCLDGSPGAYYFDSGHGNGATKWIVHLRGGGWCTDEHSCLKRSTTRLGSTKNASAMHFETILSSNKTINPDFYNWNRVFVVYCDGASFMANVEAVDPETKLYRRGSRIFDAIMEELMADKGMSDSTEAILMGDSAGGLATILNCDLFHSSLPQASKVKCFSDSGFFIHAPEIPGAIERENYFANVTAFHKLEKLLPQLCTSRLAPRPPSLCMFPEYVVEDIQTPLFLLNSVFDQVQLSYGVVPNLDKKGWKTCITSVETVKNNCTANEFQLILDFGKAFNKTLKALDDHPSRGLFINSCFIHGFVFRSNNWQRNPTLQNKAVARAFGDWYFERSSVRLVDNEHPYPIDCNATGYLN